MKKNASNKLALIFFCTVFIFEAADYLDSQTNTSSLRNVVNHSFTKESEFKAGIIPKDKRLPPIKFISDIDLRWPKA